MRGKAALGITFAVASLFGGPGQALAADGYTLNTTPPPSLTVGQPGIFQASDSNPPDDFFTRQEAAGRPLRAQAHVPQGHVVESPQPLLLHVARKRSPQAGRVRPHARGHAKASGPAGPMSGQGGERRWLCHCGQPATAGSVSAACHRIGRSEQRATRARFGW